MKKGFTMIELIFVIVILGILASVAVPRLASTREDAEIAATVANLRTLLSDANAYYIANGYFVQGKNTAKWRDFTNVSLRLDGGSMMQGAHPVDQSAYISASGKNCIEIAVKDRAGTTPAYVSVKKANPNEYICKEIHNAAPVKAYLESRLPGVSSDDKGQGDEGRIALGSSARVYDTGTTTNTNPKQ